MSVSTSIARFDSLALDCGQRLTPVHVAYETYGELNAQRSNAVLLMHAFSGDAHAAGISAETGKPGWWDNMIGPGKAFDTRSYYVISSNVLGGCGGTTGPSSTDPTTGRPYGSNFPPVSIADMVRLQKLLTESMGISRLLCVSGGSMGGMQALQWAASYPDSVASVIPIATTHRHSAQQIAFNEVGRQAILADPDFNRGDFYDGRYPERGLAVARMVGHITYMSDDSMHEKFGTHCSRAVAPTRPALSATRTGRSTTVGYTGKGKPSCCAKRVLATRSTCSRGTSGSQKCPAFGETRSNPRPLSRQIWRRFI